MSTAELTPLFPSALHPGIPIAAQILSTLRNLTAPGKGNDIRSEERAALVGVAALLGCERVQSKDLLETSAQKACSVSPAHFRSALAHSRRLLKSVDLAGLDTYPGRRSFRSQNPVSISTPLESSLGAVGPSTGTADVGPFNTPKKRFKYTSGIDVSSLVRNTPKSIRQHEPVVASPLRHSVTPSKRPISPSEVTPHNEMVDEEDARTPTKRVKFGTRAGVDLEHADVHVPEVLSSLRKRREDPSAFLAMRPGGTPLSANMSNGAGAGNMSGMGKRGIPIEDGLPDIRPVLRREKTGIKEKKREKRDWRYPEQIWGSRSEENKALLETALSKLPAWLEANEKTLEKAAGTLEEVLLGRQEI